MRCFICGFENLEAMKFRGHCTSPLAQLRSNFSFAKPAAFNFCGDEDHKRVGRACRECASDFARAAFLTAVARAEKCPRVCDRQGHLSHFYAGGIKRRT
jgi:hypothetical protein